MSEGECFIAFFIAFLFKETLGPCVAQHLAVHRGLLCILKHGWSPHQRYGAGRVCEVAPILQ